MNFVHSLATNRVLKFAIYNYCLICVIAVVSGSSSFVEMYNMYREREREKEIVFCCWWVSVGFFVKGRTRGL